MLPSLIQVKAGQCASGYLRAAMSHGKRITVDVREDIRQGREPFHRILHAVAELGPEDSLLLLAPFEPVPLFHVLAAKGFTHQSRETASGDWEVLFERASDPVDALEAAATAAARPSSGACPGAIRIDVDARGLEPPQPMVKILEALTELPPAGTLLARTDRRPMHLYDELEARGYAGLTEQQDDGSYLTTIRSR